MRKILLALGLILAATATAAAYVPALDGEFELDDQAFLSDPLVLDPLGQGVSAWLGFARPVARLTFALNHVAVGLDPRGWHLTNVAIHLAAVLLAWAFARVTLLRAGLARPEGAALAAAGLFALHPLQTESVAYVTQRGESLASGLYLAALLLLLRRDGDEAPRRRWALVAGAGALHLLGLATKPILVTLPLAWLLHAAVLPPDREAGATAWSCVRRRLPVALALLALSAVATLSTFAALGPTSQAGFESPGLSPLA